MDRDEFMNLVYDELHSDGDNNRANRIIDAADEYVEHSLAKQSAQPEIIDGRLFVTVDDIKKVGCVLVDERKSNFCRQFWMDGDGPELCEDAVSREEVLNCLEWRYPDKLPRTKIMELPSVTPKQRTGEWIPVGVVEVVGGESAMWGSAVAYHKCSKCDGQALRDDFDEEVLSKWCPHCGAKMEGVSE